MVNVVAVDTTLSGPIIGGAQTFLSDLAAGLVARGAETHLVTSGELQKKIAGPFLQSGAAIHKDLWPSPSLVEDITPGFARWVNDLHPDVYVVSVSPDIGWTALPHLRPEIATLAIAHLDSPTFFLPVSHYADFLTCAVGVSEAVCDYIRAECGVPPERVAWIPYGVYPGKCPSEMPDGASSPRLRMVYAGRLTDTQKRSSDLIRLVERLRGVSLDYRFDIVGDGPLLPDLRQALEPEIAGGRVALHGWVERQRLHQFLDDSDVLLMTSDSEGFPIVLVEAMAHGLAPVVTDIPGGNRQLVRHMKNGILVPVGRIDDFVGGIQLLARDQILLRSLRVSAWQSAQPFTMRRMIDAYLECFSAAKERARLRARAPDPGFPLMESCRSRYPLWLRRFKASAGRIAQRLPQHNALT